MLQKFNAILTAGVISLFAGQAFPTAQEEVLHGISVEKETIAIDVTSTGCTENDDFRFLIKQKGKTRTEVTVIRIEPDPCDAVAHRVILQFSRKDVRLDTVPSFLITNSFSDLLI